ncbi:MAG: CapA family protein [Firmicutes bacterium]|nr:CapA family protein [Bacillota bacterium]
MARYCGEKILAEKAKWGEKLKAPEKVVKDRLAPTSIVFTGDIGFDKYMEGRWQDENLLDGDLMRFFRGAEHVVANVEGALIIPHQDGARSQFFHSMDPAAATFLGRIGADIWCIGNNHTMDAGRSGVENTLAIASAFGARTLGAGLNVDGASAPVYLEEAGGIGLFGVAYMTECVPATATDPGVFRWDDLALIERRIREIKARCRWCVIVAHGGEEFTCMPNPYTRDRYKKYLELGADVVVAHHPHVPNQYEVFPDGKMIFYSLGNFIFDTDYQRSHAYTDRAVLLKLLFTPEKLDFEAVGIRIVRGEERVVQAELPDIFTDVREADYELLAPLAAKAHLAEDRRKMIYWKPEIFANATEEVWHDYFFGTETDGYDKGAHMDLSLIVPLAEEAELGAWKKCQLEKVKDYILKLL